VAWMLWRKVGVAIVCIAAVRQNVLTGKGMMPGFADRFTGEQMAALLAYLHSGLH